MKIKAFLIAFILVMAVIFSGCIEHDLRSQDDSDVMGNCAVSTFGHGVYYIGCSDEAFGNKLAEFKAEKNVTVTAIGVVPYSQSYIKGYFVVTDEK